MTVSWVNTVARQFNKNLNLAADNLRKQLPGLKIVVFDIYKPLEDLVKSPLTYGPNLSHEHVKPLG
jgi:phospholipase/lecithinase/hemolysin